MGRSELEARVDELQQRSRPAAFVVAVVKKYNDDRAGNLAALVAYYGFLSIFPLLLLFVTIVGFVLHDHPSLRADLLDSALSDFPIVGAQLRRNIDALDGDVLALVVGALGAVWVSLGVAHAMQHAMAEIWDIPVRVRPRYLVRLGRALLLVLVLGLSVVAVTAMSAAVASVPGSAPVAVASALATLALNIGLYVAAFRVLTPSEITTGNLWPGAVLGGVFWSALQALGGWLVARELRNASELYGFFGIVLGLLFFLVLAARLSLYAAEVNVVRARRLYPRNLFDAPLTPADRRVYTDAAVAEERVPQQDVDVRFER
jgi:YihY family inner membrane protein